MKKVLLVAMCICLLVSFAACSGGGSATKAPASEAPASAAPAPAAAKNIVILTPSEDHGWTGSVATFAKAKAEEINAAGVYTAEVITADSAATQISKIEDVLTDTSKLAGIVILPYDDTVGSAIQQVVDAKVPYVAFDRIIADVAATAVSNVKGDNEGIGAATAAYFVSLGMKPGEKVYVYQGDTSSVTTTRGDGFKKYLTGELEYNGAKIADDAKWTADQLASITESGAMNWSRSATKEHFESLMGNADSASIKWFYTQDDELAMGILEALNGTAIDDATKKAFLANKPVITAAGGLKELYTVLEGTLYPELYAQLGGFMSVTYNPSMIQLAIQDMVDYLDGKTVAQDHVISCQIVTADNVSEFEPFS